MPGRPKMMAKKIADLELKMEEVWELLEKYMPKLYETWGGPGEPLLEKTSELCQGWNYAVFGIIDATGRVADLAQMLRAKAGISEEDFRAAYRAERLAKMAGKNEQREHPQAVACCVQGTSGEPMGSVDIPSPSQ